MAKNGRPTKYSEELLEACEDYLENYEDAIPSHIGLFLHIKVGKSTAYEWADPKSDYYHEEFSEILERCMAMQHQVLINKGLDSTHNAAITALVLGKHGYHKKVDQDHTTGGEKISNNFVIQPVRGRDE